MHVTLEGLDATASFKEAAEGRQLHELAAAIQKTDPTLVTASSEGTTNKGTYSLTYNGSMDQLLLLIDEHKFFVVDQTFLPGVRTTIKVTDDPMQSEYGRAHLGYRDRSIDRQIAAIKPR